MSRPRITLIVGLPGSGKSTISRRLAAEAGIVDRHDDDDDFLRGHLKPPFGLDGAIGRLKAGESCVVNDIALCKADKRGWIEDRLQAEVPDAEIRWHFFDNDPLQCAANVILDWFHKRRGDAMDRVGAIRYYSYVYQPPLGQTHRVVGVLPDLNP